MSLSLSTSLRRLAFLMKRFLATQLAVLCLTSVALAGLAAPSRGSADPANESPSTEELGSSSEQESPAPEQVASPTAAEALSASAPGPAEARDDDSSMDSPLTTEEESQASAESDAENSTEPELEDDRHSAEERDPAQFNGLPIESITIRNDVGRTRPAFVLAKLGLRARMVFQAAELEAGLDRLMDTRIFKEASAEVFRRGGGVHIEVTLDEKWTLLPDIRFGGGGGTAYFRFGLFDINWFGLGGQGLISYENRNGTHNGDAWLRYPRFLGSPLLVGAGVTRSTTLFTNYGPDRGVLGGEAFTSTRLLFDFEWDPYSFLTLGYRMEPEWLRFNHDQIGEDVKRANRRISRTPTDPSRRILHRISLRWHSLRYVGVLREGHELTLHYVPAIAGLATERSSVTTRSDLKLFFLFPFEANLALRFVLGTGSDSRPENLQWIGGLTEVRGYFDAEFLGQVVAFGNLEIRKNLFNTSSFVWQGAAFYDYGFVGDTVPSLVEARLRDAVGFGLRIVPDFVHLVAFRLDYARGLSDPRNDGGLSFGVVQFF